MAIDDAQSGRDAAVRASINRLAEAGPDELLRFLTPEMLAADAEVSSGSIRYQFTVSKSTRQFSRRLLALKMVDAFTKQLHVETRHNAESYEQAARTVELSRSWHSILPAVAGDLRDSNPETDNETAARERVYFLALLLADTDEEIAAKLRDAFRDNQATYVDAYQAFLRASGRRLRKGRTLPELQTAMVALLEGLGVHRRVGMELSDEQVADIVITLFWAYTSPENGPDRDPYEEMFA